MQNQKQDSQCQSLAGRIQRSYSACMEKLSKYAFTSHFNYPALLTPLQYLSARERARGDNIPHSVRSHGMTISKDNKLILCRRTNIKVFQIVLNIQKIITNIPAQIERQQPVWLVDATGRSSPFHLEFVRSAKVWRDHTAKIVDKQLTSPVQALVAVLALNFEYLGPAADMVRDGDFVIQEEGTCIDIDLSQTWESCFFPGRRVNMSMIFARSKNTDMDCPKCKAVIKGESGRDIEW